jgi:hypothetical protein
MLDEYEQQSPPDFLISVEFIVFTNLLSSSEKRDNFTEALSSNEWRDAHTDT